MQQMLDDSHTTDASGAQALQRAAELVPLVDGSRLPAKVLQVFAARGQPGVALALLRQRPDSAGKSGCLAGALWAARRWASGIVGCSGSRAAAGPGNATVCLQHA